MKRVFEWKEPPPANSRGVPKGSKAPRWTDTLVQLATRPGEWALVAEELCGGGGIAVSARNRHPDFEWVQRKENGTGTLYARYIGEAS